MLIKTSIIYKLFSIKKNEKNFNQIATNVLVRPAIKTIFVKRYGYESFVAKRTCP